MFFRLFYYNVRRQLRDRELVFWNLLFPIILGTLFVTAFGNYMQKEETFLTVDVAYVTEDKENTGFSELLDTLKDGEDPLLSVKVCDMEEAKLLLEEKEVRGIFVNEEEGIRLYVKEEGITESILKTILDQYRKTEAMITKIMQQNPKKLETVIAGMSEEISFVREEKYTDASMDGMMEYFYALIAMSCLYGCFAGVVCAVSSKADVTPLAARRSIASTNRFVALAADLTSAVVQQFCYTMIAVLYLKYIQKVQFGDKMPYLLIVVTVGAFIGVATGFFIGSLGKAKEGTKIGLALSFTMLECFLSGLMVGNMYHIIQRICPILNKINPAALIVDALYSLDIYSDFRRFWSNMEIMGILSLLLIVAGFLTVRKERYASL